MVYDLIVIGSGSVGAAAGWYATRAGLKVLMIDSAHPLIRKAAITAPRGLSATPTAKARAMCRWCCARNSSGTSWKR